MNFRVKTDKALNICILVLLSVGVYTISVFLLSAYVGGDQVHYREFYSEAASTALSQLIFLGEVHLGASEPISLFLLWLGANIGIEKIIYISSLNVILVCSLYLLARKYRASWIVIFLLLTNFYVLVLLTGAERLKFAYIFVVLSILIGGRLGLMLGVLSSLAHFQNFILLVGALFGSLSQALKSLVFRLYLSKYLAWIFVLSIIFPVFVFVNFGDAISGKLVVYSSRQKSYYDLLQICLFSVAAIFVSRDRFRMFLSLLPMLPAVLLLGGSRVNMIAFTIVVFFLLLERRLSHPTFLVLLSYFSLKSVFFVVNIIIYGNGFA
ncbi:MAG TPA: hypothetical protein VFN01_06395 [Marinobacter sp.]|uniref:hypothetical protein n=1 Tax=Marinobacter sp. TaxID=50741 RepID=UPI002D7FF857|nr:hypothetical protein [Marinobacter sp.]HET8800799.1 hypothetical protein [Marinobacter sp.]